MYDHISCLGLQENDVLHIQNMKKTNCMQNDVGTYMGMRHTYMSLFPIWVPSYTQGASVVCCPQAGETVWIY